METARAMSESTPTLEQKIAAALNASDIESSDLDMLLSAVEAAAQAADEAAAKVREAALDPATVIDAAKVGAAVATAELVRDRLQVALPRLQERLRQVRHAEDVAAWTTEAEELEARRKALMIEFRKFYPEMIERIVAHLYSMRALDNEIDHVNSRRPDGSMTPLALSTPFFAPDLKIPHPDGRGGHVLWPPPQPNLALQYLASMPPDTFIASEAAAGTYLKEGNRRMLEDNRRQIAEAEERKRGHEEREAAEARKAQGADRAAYYAEHGWPT
jgi:hypothetical protein